MKTTLTLTDLAEQLERHARVARRAAAGDRSAAEAIAANVDECGKYSCWAQLCIDALVLLDHRPLSGCGDLEMGVRGDGK